MTDRSSLFATAVTALAIATAGCSSGGGGSPTPAPAPAPSPAPSSASPSIQVLPATFDFGKVTTGNTPAPLQVTISNSGTAPLSVTGIVLNSPSGPPYALALGGGAKPCGSTTPSVAVGDACTVQVLFQPATGGTFNATLQVSSNASNAPTVSLPIVGTAEQVQTLSVRVNQIDFACPSPTNTATAYVSVTDQGGFSVLGLLAANFLVFQGAAPGLQPTTANFLNQVYKNVAISAVLDNSGSLTDQPVAFADMRSGFTNLFAGLKSGDIGEVIKFASEYQVVQAFTPDKAALQAAISAPFNMGRDTRLYDAVYQAVEDTAKQTNYRRAVIVATDGKENLPVAPVYTLQAVINNARSKNVPVFAVALGASIDEASLRRMAEETGGIYYQASASQNLATIYQQLATLLYEQQYVLTFQVTGSATYDVRIRATTPTSVSGEGIKPITACTP